MNPLPRQVLIAGGKPYGGISSYATALHSGFADLGLDARIVRQQEVVEQRDNLRDPTRLKILSLAAVFAAPLARRAICVAHGVPCAAHQGWTTTLGVLASYRLANACCGTQLVAVSDYSSVHLSAIFGLRVDAAIRNAVRAEFLATTAHARAGKNIVMFAGRLHRSKHVAQILAAMQTVLEDGSAEECWIAGDGDQRELVAAAARADARIVYFGNLATDELRMRLGSARVFVSANPTEPFGICYLEALSQGCNVAMPASGGGIEIATPAIHRRIFLFPPSGTAGEIAAALRCALRSQPCALDLEAYAPRRMAEAYLEADARFRSDGTFRPGERA